MSVEETLAQQFQEFRNWQLRQEEILLATQKDDREFLLSEQNRVFQALNLSIDEISQTDQSPKEDANLIDLDTPDDECTSPKMKNSNDLLAIENNNDKNFGLEVPNMMLNLKNTAAESKPNLDYSYNQLDTLSDLSKTDLQSFFSDHSFRSNIPIDDIPLPSPKKDFETLLEEKLRDSGEILINTSFKPAVKKPFLKKGEGLARFKPSPARKNQNIPKCTLKSRHSLPANPQSSNKPCQTSNSDKSTLSKSKTNNVKRKSLPNIPPVAQKKLTLKNVPLPKKKNCIKPAETRSNKLCVKDKKTSELMSDPSSSDLELKNKREQEEVRIFELLEDKAENSSFCSTSSTVIAFLQQSTPLKHKALLHSASKNRISFDDIGDQTLEEIIQSTKSNRLPLPQLPENEVEDQNSYEWESLPNSKTSNQVILPYGTDVEVDYENYNPNIGENNGENQASLHVRFAEHNEYKNITDNSSVSSDSHTIMNHADDKGAWSDCSATDSSDAESTLLYKLQKENTGQTNFQSLEFMRKNVATHDEDITELYDHEEEENDTESESGLKNDTFCADTTEDDEKYNTMTLLKSELLKNRLIELEREIEIFRKENASLTFQRQKLQEERTKLQEERISLQRSFKEQKEALEIEKKNMESVLQEERKRIIREKAALENRLKDAYDKSQKSKQERQEIQALRDQLDELREEYRQKENKWTASNARQRSQMRVLQTENAKLKQELEKMQEQKNARFRKKTNTGNTKAIHQINKALASRKKTSPFKNEEEVLLEDEDKVPELDDFIRKLDLEVLKDEEDSERQKIAKTAQSIARTRDLYESLLRDAVDDFSDVQNQKKISQTESQENSSESSNDNGTSNDQDSDHNRTMILDSPHKELEKSDDEKKVEQKIQSSKREIREVHHPDGHIEYWYPNGNVKKVFPDLNLSKIIYYNGDVRINKDDGTVKYFYASSRTWHTTTPDGSEILEYTDGQIEKKSIDGTTEVIFTDGSVKLVHPDGSEKWSLNDGTIAETTPDGDKILIFPNGQREIHTKESKRREYPDGTVKFVYPDGVQETRYANGRVRLKDKHGNLIMDSYQQ